MILNNYWQLKYAVDSGIFRYTGNSKAENIGIVTMAGASSNTLIAAYGGDASRQIHNMQLKSNLRCVLGSGTTPPERTDYALETDISSSISSLSVVCSTSYQNGQEITTLTITGTNLTGSALTINEIGICKTIYYDNSSNATVDVLLVREVLDTPIVIGAGSGLSKTYTWTENDIADTAANATRGALMEVKSENEEKRTEPILEPLEEKKEDLSLDVEKAENEDEKGVETLDTEEDEDEAEK